MSLGTLNVGRPKKPAKKAGTPEPKTIGFRVSGEYGAWLDEFADHQRMPVASVIDRALAKLAEIEGFGSAPPKRLP
jgi:hypothetical protein